MNNKLALICGALLLCASGNLWAQKAPFKFGDIPMEDMKMTVYPKDSSASAVVLGDFGISTFDYSSTNGFQIEFERVRRIKILTKDGLKHADFQIPIWRVGDSKEGVSGLKVVTYNLENGKIVETKGKSDSFFDEEFDKNLTYKKITWPAVKEGSVIEISYRLRSDFLFNFQDWEFQSTIPVRHSEYRAAIPEYFSYQKSMQGYVPLAVNETSSQTGSVSLTVRGEEGVNGERGKLSSETVQFNEEKFRWIAKDVPAFKAEPFIATSSDYISKINFELAYTKFPGSPMKTYMGSWEDIARKYWEEVSSEINAPGGLKDDVAAATAGATSDEQKVAGIFNFVRQTVLWDETYRKYPSQTPRKVLDSKKGSSADINILLLAMLDKAQIKAYPVLLSTRNHGFIREGVPLSQQFNYVICQAMIGDKYVLLDATSRMLPLGVIPERCLNGKGMAVTPESLQWVSLQPTVKSRMMYNAEIVLTDAGEVNAILKVDKSGYFSAQARNTYLLKGENDYVKEFVSPMQWNVSKSEFANVKEIHLPFKETHQFTVSDQATISANTIYYNPFIIAREDENPFKTEKREYPVDFGNTFEQFYQARITIPEGYVVEELPQPKVMMMPENAAKYTYSLTQQGNAINFTSSLAINRAMFTQDQYPNLREFYNQVIAKQAEQIVLKKK